MRTANVQTSRASARPRREIAQKVAFLAGLWLPLSISLPVIRTAQVAPDSVPRTFTVNSAADRLGPAPTTRRPRSGLTPLILVVNSPDDVVAAGPLDDGNCATAYYNGQPNGTCTLRAAIMKANHWPEGGGIILLPALPAGARYTLTIPASGPDDESTGDLNINAKMDIVGFGASHTIIDGNGSFIKDRVFTIANSGSLALSGVTVQGGRGQLGLGGSEDGGGIENRGNLVLYNSTITDNRAPFTGGGIANSGTLTVYTSTISSNRANSGGGVTNWSSGTMTLVATTINNNTAVLGGGIESGGTGVTLVNSTIRGNHAGQDGGGLYDQGTATLINSTVSSNQANRDGGGIWTGDGFGPSVVKLFSVTVADNQADADLNGTGMGGGIFNANGGTPNTVQLRNSLLADNLASDYDPDRQIYFGVPNDCAGYLTSLDYNLVSLTSGCTFAAVQNDQTNIAAYLGPLQANGGPTWTHALLPGSPAIDAGNPGGCTNQFGAILTTDQRGYPRTANGAGTTRCDIGAYEVQRVLNLPLIIR